MSDINGDGDKAGNGIPTFWKETFFVESLQQNIQFLRFFELPKMIQRKSVKSVTEKRTLEFLIS
jgi:hypothetical protein